MKKVVIIGASSGIGRELAIKYAKIGCKVGIAARREDRLKDIQKEFPNNIEYSIIDVQKNNCNTELESLINKIGGVDLYIHCSGFGSHNVELDEDIEVHTVNTNCLGFTHMIGYIFNHFREKGGGHIAAISSIAGTKGLGAAPSYSASKKYQSTYIEALSQLSNMQKLNIKLTDIRPGFIKTDFIGNDNNYPMVMKSYYAAKKIFKAINSKKNISIIDFRYKILVTLWRLIPRSLWIKLRIK